MSRTERNMPCSPQDVFDVLADGWLYATWVVGASRIRDVDPDWPLVGSRIHHSVGAWPMLIDDTTHVLEYEPPRRIRLRARAWPTGEAEVLIEATPTAEGAAVTVTEDAVKGPGAFIPAPLRHLMLDRRNRETLLRLEMLAVGRAKTAHPDDDISRNSTP